MIGRFRPFFIYYITFFITNITLVHLLLYFLNLFGYYITLVLFSYYITLVLLLLYFLNLLAFYIMLVLLLLYFLNLFGYYIMFFIMLILSSCTACCLLESTSGSLGSMLSPTSPFSFLSSASTFSMLLLSTSPNYTTLKLIITKGFSYYIMYYIHLLAFSSKCNGMSCVVLMLHHTLCHLMFILLQLHHVISHFHFSCFFFLFLFPFFFFFRQNLLIHHQSCSF